jgi:coatomer subunit beta'
MSVVFKDQLEVESQTRVTCVAFHTEKPLILAGYFDGRIQVWNYETQELITDREIVANTPVRCAKFFPNTGMVITGWDDYYIRIFDPNEPENVTVIDAHEDYIRSIAIHPTLPLFLSASDDCKIKLWKWEGDKSPVQVFSGHDHYVWEVKFNPDDPNTFASASLDRTIKIWTIGNPDADFTLEGHDQPVNTIEYFRHGGKLYLASGSDDYTVRTWDYETKTCLHVKHGHDHYVVSLCFYAPLSILWSGSEDQTVRRWEPCPDYDTSASTDYGMGKCRALASSSFSNHVVCAFFDGFVVIQIEEQK